MNQFAIITDSASNLSDSTMEQHGIRAISYRSSVSGKEFLCYVRGRDHVSACREFYAAMRAGAEIKTTMVNLQTFLDEFAIELEEGRDVLFVGISSGLSGTCHAAELAASELRLRYPDRRIEVIDSMSASLGEGLSVVRAARLRAAGRSLAETAAILRDERQSIINEFTVADLKYLRRGGRISPLVALAGSLLNIKPLLAASREGTIVMLGKERGEKKALAALAERLARQIVDPERQTIGIAHCDNPAGAEYLAAQINARVKVGGIVTEYYDLCTGAHVGPGTVALFYRGTERELSDPDVNAHAVPA